MIYLDNAATTFPKPPSVLRAAARFLNCGNPGRSGHRLSLDAAREVYACREAAASLFGAKPENVVFTLNATYALNIAVKTSYHGGAVLTSDLEHNAVVRPCRALTDDIRTFDSHPEIACPEERSAAILASFREALTPDVGLVVATAASNICGAALPVGELGKLARERNVCFIVDGAQAGGLYDLDLARDFIDVLCLPGHKGLYGPTGSGLLLIGDERERPTLIEGGSGVFSRSPFMPDDPPERFEAGTLPVAAIAGLRAGMTEVKRRGTANLLARETALASRAAEALAALPGVTVHASVQRGTIVLFSAAGRLSEEIGAELDRRGVCVRSGLHCAPLAHDRLGTPGGAVRASFGMFNTERDADALAEAVREILG